jgi:septum formation protein
VLQIGKHQIVLASKSSGRIALLRGAGLDFDTRPADLDERAIEATLHEGGVTPDPTDVAMLLALSKAEHISQQLPDAYVIGADQVLALGDRIYEKPASMEVARDNLLAFRGRTHYLHSAVCVVRNGEALWQHVDSAGMTMRAFSDAFLMEYLATAGASVMTSVGAYRLEGVGVHLFERIEGDYFTILGLPLVALLDFLRSEGVVVG